MITQEQIDVLPLIPLEEFRKKVEEQKKNNFVIRKLDNECGGWESWPPHLIRDLFFRIGARPIINKY